MPHTRERGERERYLTTGCTGGKKDGEEVGERVALPAIETY